MNKFLFAFVAFSIMPKMAAQEIIRKNIKGKVTASANNLGGIYVLNMKTEETARTQDGGYFSIPATEGDSIMFSSTQFKARKIAIKDEDLCKELILVKMEPMMNQLAEVQVFRYDNINAVALGIIPKGTKTYTPAERKYRTATGLDAQIGLNTSLTIDPLFNMLSGRSAELAKNIIVEKKEHLLDRIDYMFDREYFTLKLKIPEEHVKGFEYYLVENARFVALINANNKSMATFMMGEMAVKYLEIIAIEKK
ncbi:MAG TPA: hypothetical protein VK528_03990 [Flavobacterium sp.]|nr:hypothetical protein [Flavobacterium sp.]